MSTSLYPDIEQKLIWQAKNIEVPNWRKVAVELPNNIDEYRLLFEGEYNKTTNYYTRNYVTIDNLQLRSCSHEGNIINIKPVLSLYLCLDPPLPCFVTL